MRASKPRILKFTELATIKRLNPLFTSMHINWLTSATLIKTTINRAITHNLACSSQGYLSTLQKYWMQNMADRFFWAIYNLELEIYDEKHDASEKCSALDILKPDY